MLDISKDNVIDHIDRDITNNHISNLRNITHQENDFNRTDVITAVSAVRFEQSTCVGLKMVVVKFIIDALTANFATDGNSDLVIINAQTIRIDINGMLSDLPPYAMLSLKQLEFISDADLAAGLVMVYKGSVANQMSMNKGDPVLAICPFDHTKGALYLEKKKEANVHEPCTLNDGQTQI